MKYTIVRHRELGELFAVYEGNKIFYISFLENIPSHLMSETNDVSFMFDTKELEFKINYKLNNYLLAKIDNPNTKHDFDIVFSGTEFQSRVWKEISRLKPHEVITYSELAYRIDSPSSVRAVASACAKNKIALLIPCHQIIGMNSNEYKYRWKPERKKYLLSKIIK
jgi:O-6-methylguanine DNA methyltransferase